MKYRPEAKSVINYFTTKILKPFYLVVTVMRNVKQLAEQLGIDKVIAEQTPEQKLQKIAELNAACPNSNGG